MDLEGYEYVELAGMGPNKSKQWENRDLLALNDGTYFKNVQVVYLE